MKNLFFALIAMIAFTVFSGCNKDDDDMGTTVKNEFTYDGTTYSLAKGYLNDVGANFNSTHDFDVFLASTGVSKSGSSLTGTGDLIYLDLNTNSATGLEVGTYNWSDTRTAFSIVPGSQIYTDYNFGSFTGTTISATAGTVDVAIDGMETTVTFNLTTSDGKTVTGEWKGVLEDI
ncbi:hypothetical protein [Lewinella cohaerens]|uniref:hypothetical protein n=1 Tax=Lewinella cohaerens TaxID=70995 RepID=UPI00037B1782|nr:hypothetical protein [Lewinella cohaerens]